MRFLFVSQGSELLPLAIRVQDEGHTVQFVSGLSSGKGIVPWQSLYEVTDRKGFDIGVVQGHEMGKLREVLHKDFPTIGPTIMSDNVLGDKDIRHKFFALMDVPYEEILGTKHECELVLNGWFNGIEFIQPTFYQLWSQNALTGGLGPVLARAPGRAGAPCFSMLRASAELLHPLVTPLRRCDHRGPVGLRIAVTGTDALVLEPIFDFRPMEIFLEGFEEVGKTLALVARGEANKIHFRDSFYCGVMFEGPLGKPLRNLDEHNLKHLLLSGVAAGDKSWFVSEETVGMATAWGEDYHQARRRAYRTLRLLELEDIGYRTDIGLTAKTDHERLHNWGWI